MNKAIWKYTLLPQTKQEMILPLNSKILSVKVQHEEIVLYALVDPDETSIETVDIIILGTGHKIADESIRDYVFLDTVKMNNGHLMFHVFYRQYDFW